MLTGPSPLRLPHTPDRGCYRPPGLPLTFHWALRLWRPLPPINAARSPATVVPLTFPIPCWLSVRVYQRESEAPLKSLFPFVTFSEDPMVKEGMNAGASHMELPPPLRR